MRTLKFTCAPPPCRVWWLTLGFAAGAGQLFCPDGGIALLGGIFLAAIWLRNWRGGAAVTVAVILGALGAGVSQWNYYRSLPPASFGVYRLRVDDPRLTTAPGIPAPNSVLATATSPWRGRVRLYFAPPEISYGSLLEVRGRLVPATADQSRKIFGRIYPQKVQVVGQEPGWYGKLLRLRDRGIARATRHFTDPELRSLAAALFFGVSGGLSGELRQSFVNSGTVHVFTVSGMHVALVAALLLLALRAVSPGKRAAFLISGCALYVAMTGANPPALRAGFMISLYVWLRGANWGIRRLDALGLAGLALLLVNPALVTDFGAQYSLVLTAALIVGAESLGQHRAAEARFWALGEKRFIPHSGSAWNYLILCAIGAFFTLGIALAHGNVIAPGQVIANVVLGLITPLVFLALGMAILCPALGKAAEILLYIARSWCGVISQLILPEHFAQLFPAAAVGFYIAAFGVLTLRGKLRYWALAVALAVPLWWIAAGQPDQVAVVGTGATTSPTVICFSGVAGEATLFFDAQANRPKVMDYLHRHGISRVESVILPGKSAKIGDEARIIGRNSILPRRGRILSPRAPYRLEYFFPGSKLKVELVLTPTSAGWRISGRTSAGESFAAQPHYSAQGFEWKREF